MITPTNRPLIVAHRGASKAERENTVAAFRAAARLGAGMVELDVRSTADGALVVHHDAVVAGRAIITMRTDELPAYVPNLNESLDACAGMEVNIEIKSDRDEPDYNADQPVAARVVELLASRGDSQRMLISSFDLDTIAAVRALEPALRTGFLFVKPGRDAGRLFDKVAAGGHVALHPNRHAATAELVDAAHARGLAVNVWTVDKPAEMRRLASIGVDAIITNVPDVALATLGFGVSP